LRDLLASRLDPLSADAAETGQLAAALGREVRFEVLAAIGHRDSLSLRADIRELVDAGLLLQRPRVQPESYIFKHALVRDAAYERMTRLTRQDVHERIADTLLKCFPDVARSRPEVLAQHFEGAGKPHEAAAHWKRSGDVTMARGAYVESIRHFEHAMSLLEGVSDRRARAQLELSLLESLGTAQIATQGYASPEVEQTFGRAQRLCDEVGEDAPARVLHGIWGVLIMRGEREATAEFLPRFHRLAARSPDPVSLITSHGHTGLRAFFTGDFTTALEEMTTATTWYSTPEYRAFVRDYGYDGGMYPFGYRVLSLWILGQPERAAAARDEMLAVAAASGNPYGLAIADSFAVVLAILNGEPAEALDGANRLAEHAGQQKLFFFVSTAMCVQGWAAVQDGRPDDGVALIQQGLGILQMIGVRAFYAFYHSLLVEAQLARGAVEEGLAAAEEGIQLCRTTVDCFYEAELLRLRGALLELRGDTAAANASYREAVEVARSQGAAAFELRAAMSLARLGADDGGPKWLDEALGRFSADVTTQDVAQARALAAGGTIQ
jgi:tetratricopeptide (TPR) repeat protein